MFWRSHIDLAAKRIRKAVARRIAASWQYTDRAQHQLGVWRLRYGYIALYALLLLLVLELRPEPVEQEEAPA
jgi:hypothetical protein